jgi:transcriptional regulator with XRE-family HTH domain
MLLLILEVVVMNERIKQLRLTLKLSQEEFGKILGITKSGISSIENGQRSVTDKHIKLLLSECNVSENWLRTGEGEMLITLPPEDEYMKAASEISLSPDDEIIRQIIIEYWKLNTEGKKLLKNFMMNIAKNIEREE